MDSGMSRIGIASRRELKEGRGGRSSTKNLRDFRGSLSVIFV